jgi:hypothetical protein
MRRAGVHHAHARRGGVAAGNGAARAQPGERMLRVGVLVST